MAQKQFLDLTGLQQYDAKSKQLMDEKTAAAVAESKKYFDDNADQFDPAGTATSKVQELRDGEINDLQNAVNTLNGASTVNGSVDKKVADAKAELQSDIDAVTAKADKNTSDITTNKDDIATMKGKIATLEAGTYDDTEVRELIQDNTDEITALKAKDTAVEARVKANEDALAVLNGTAAGSVKKQIDDALNKFATDVTNDDVVNSYKELIDWAAEHGSEAAEMVDEIEANATAIAQLEKYVGTLPAGTNAADVIAYINEKVAAEQSRAEGAETGLSTRISDVESQIEEVETNAAADATAKADAALASAKAYTNTEVGKIDLSGITTNATDIASLKTRASANEADIDTLQAAIADNGSVTAKITAAQNAANKAQSEVDALETTVGTVSAKANTNATDITTLKSTTASHTTQITELESKVGDGCVAITSTQIDAMFA